MEINKLIPNGSEILRIKVNRPITLKGIFYYDRYVEEKSVEVSRSKLFGIFKSKFKETRKIPRHRVIVIGTDNPIIFELTEDNYNKLKNGDSIHIPTFFDVKASLGEKVGEKWELNTTLYLEIDYYDATISDMTTKKVYFTNIDELRDFILNSSFIKRDNIYIDGSDKFINNITEYIKNL